MIIDQQKLDQLILDTPHAKATEDFAQDYIGVFAQPNPEGACLCCGAYGSFTWGIQHGEGSCFKCGWPARLYHFIKTPEGEEKRIVRLLQYHPDAITLKGVA